MTKNDIETCNTMNLDSTDLDKTHAVIRENWPSDTHAQFLHFIFIYLVIAHFSLGKPQMYFTIMK